MLCGMGLKIIRVSGFGQNILQLSFPSIEIGVVALISSKFTTEINGLMS